MNLQVLLMSVPCLILVFGYWAAWRRWFALRAEAALGHLPQAGESGGAAFQRIYGRQLSLMHFMRGLAVNIAFSLTVLGLIFALSTGVERLQESMRHVGMAFGFMLAGLAVQIIESASEMILVREEGRLAFLPASALAETSQPAGTEVELGSPATSTVEGVA